MKPTWTAIFVGGVVLLVAGIGLNTLEFVYLGSIAIAVSLYALAFTRRKIALEVERVVRPDRVSVGEPAALVVSISNPSSWPSPGLIGRTHDGLVPREFFISTLAPGSSDERSVPLRTEKRGVYVLDPVELIRADPLRLAGASRRYGEAATLYVHPRVHKMAALPAASIKEVEGIRANRSPHGSESFHALREYVYGDDYRLIHWKSSARSGDLVVKQFVDLWCSEVLIVLDTRAASYRESAFEDAIEVVASLAVASAASRHGVSITLGSRRSASVHPGTRHHLDLLDLLAGADLGESEGLVSLARRIAGAKTTRALVLVTGEPEPAEVLSFLSATRAFQRRLVVQIAPGMDDSPYVEMSRSGDEAISANNVEDFLAGWARLVS